MTAQVLSIPVAQATNPAIVQGTAMPSGRGDGTSSAVNTDAASSSGSTGAFSAAMQASGAPGRAKTDGQLAQTETVPGLSKLQYSTLDRSRIWMPLAVPGSSETGSDLLKPAVEEMALTRDLTGEGLPLAGKALPPVHPLPVEPPKTLADFQASEFGRPVPSGIPAMQIQPGRNLILPGTDHPTDRPLPEQARAADILARMTATGVGGTAQVTQPGEPIVERLSAFERSQISGESGHRDATLRSSDPATKQILDARSDTSQLFSRMLGADSGGNSQAGSSTNSLANFQANSWASSLSSSPLNSLANYAGNAPPGPLSDTASPTQMLRQPLLQPLADQAAWTKGLGDRMLTMSENGVHTARIKLYPEHLGQLEVRIQLEQDTARVWFTAHHGQTREALESALPRLKEMFQEQGLSLVQTDVDTKQQDHSNGSDTSDPMNRRFDSPEPTVSAALLTLSAPSDRLLDVVV